MLGVLIAISVLVLIVGLTFLNSYWLITLDELEIDHLNPADVTKNLNKFVLPEIISHGVLLLLCLFGWAPWIFLLNIPLGLWHARRYHRKEHLLDPTEILKYKQLKSIRHEIILKTVFYGLQIIYSMYWMVSSIVIAAKGTGHQGFP